MSSPQFSLGHADWGVLMWPLEWYSSDDEYEYYTLKCGAEASGEPAGCHAEGPNVSWQPTIYSFNSLHICITRSFLIVRYCGSWQKKLLEQLAVQRGVTGLKKNDAIMEIMTKLAHKIHPNDQAFVDLVHQVWSRKQNEAAQPKENLFNLTCDVMLTKMSWSISMKKTKKSKILSGERSCQAQNQGKSSHAS